MKLLDTTSPKNTFDIEGEVPHPLVVAANEAFIRIENHRKLFRTDWLPFINGVYHLSIIAWERTGSHTTLDGKPDWTYDPIQGEFRELIKDLPWARYLMARRPLLTVLRAIGGERERFLAWYDGQEESFREFVGRPETLLKKYKQNVTRGRAHDKSDFEDEKAVTAARSNSEDEKAVTAARSNSEDEKAVISAPFDSEKEKAVTAARTDAERITALVTSNEAWSAFGTRLRESVNDGRSALELELRDELDVRLKDGLS